MQNTFDCRRNCFGTGENEKAGKETALNTLDAQSQLIDAKINYTSAFYDHLLGGLSVMTTGYLTPET